MKLKALKQNFNILNFILTNESLNDEEFKAALDEYIENSFFTTDDGFETTHNLISELNIHGHRDLSLYLCEKAINICHDLLGADELIENEPDSES